MPTAKTTHLMLLGAPAWGHVRPLLVLATRLLLERDGLILTVILPPNMLDKALADLTIHFQQDSLAPHRQRIRVVAPFDTQELDVFKVMTEFIAAYPAMYQMLLQEKPITCARTGNTFSALPAPMAIIMDFFSLGHLRVARAMSGNSVPIIAWITSTCGSIIRLFGPKEFGGLGEFDAGIEAEVKRTGRPIEELSEQIYTTTNGNIMNVAGIPPMYDHELFPQLLPVGIPVAPVAKVAYTFLKESDGVIIATTETYESPATVQAFKSWMSGWGKTTFGIGPLLPIGYGTSAVSSNDDDDVVVEFLEKCLRKYGEKSVLFISFGTIFWPMNVEYVEELIEVLIEKELPFVFCYASPLANIPDQIKQKVEASGIGLLSKWAPQQYILTHKCIGWFLTHGGHGGTTEALSMGIPLIGWPFAGDQPIGMVQLAEDHKVAVELVEVRTGEHGMKPIRRLGDRTPVGTRKAVGSEIREVVDHLRGPKGQEMAQNVTRLRNVIAKLWETGGAGKREIAVFLEKFVDSRVGVAA